MACVDTNVLGSDLVNAKEDQAKTSHFHATVADSRSTNKQAQNVFEALY